VSSVGRVSNNVVQPQTHDNPRYSHRLLFASRSALTPPYFSRPVVSIRSSRPSWPENLQLTFFAIVSYTNIPQEAVPQEADEGATDWQGKRKGQRIVMWCGCGLRFSEIWNYCGREETQLIAASSLSFNSQLAWRDAAAKNGGWWNGSVRLTDIWPIQLDTRTVTKDIKQDDVCNRRDRSVVSEVIIIGTARVVRYTVSVLLSVPFTCRSPLPRVCCCGPGEQEISIDCCPALSSSRAAARRAAANADNARLSADVGS